MLNRYLAIEPGVQGTGWNWNYKCGVNSLQTVCKVMRLDEIMERVNVKRRGPGLSPGVFQCLEVGVIKKFQYRRLRRSTWQRQRQARGRECPWRKK